MTPAVVAITENHERLIGQAAWRQSITNPQGTVFYIQRFLGLKFTDPELKQLIPDLSYKLTEAPDGGVSVLLDGNEYSPTELLAMLIRKHKTEAEAYLGQAISGVVITVPAYFNSEQREATKEAGRLAGLEVLRIINEPTAVCLAYGFDKKNDAILIIYDFGGVTFKVAILDIRGGVINTRSSRSDTCLGGENFDLRFLDYLANAFMQENQIDLRQHRQAWQCLQDAAEKAKLELSKSAHTEIPQPYITADSPGTKLLTMTLTREKLESA